MRDRETLTRTKLGQNGQGRGTGEGHGRGPGKHGAWSLQPKPGGSYGGKMDDRP
jgi:hypothetical protein